MLVSGCKEVTQEVWNLLVGDIKTQQTEEPYYKSVQIKASIADATGDTEIETALFATGGESFVECNDGKVFDLLGTFDAIEQIYTFQRFELLYDGQSCGLYVYFFGPWNPLQVRYFFDNLDFTTDQLENIFINFKTLTVE